MILLFCYDKSLTEIYNCRFSRWHEQHLGLVARITTASEDGVAHGRPGRPRKFYRLTEAGRRVLNAELARLQGLVATAQRRLALSGGR